MATVIRRIDKTGRIYYINTDTGEHRDKRAWRISLIARHKAHVLKKIRKRREQSLIKVGAITQENLEYVELADLKIKKVKNYKPRDNVNGRTRIRWGFVGHGLEISEDYIIGSKAVDGVLSIKQIVNKSSFNHPAVLDFFAKYAELIIEGGIEIAWYEKLEETKLNELGQHTYIGRALRKPLKYDWDTNRSEILYLASM